MAFDSTTPPAAQERPQEPTTLAAAWFYASASIIVVVFGLAWSGAMTAPRLASLIQNLPPGASEIYLHPATRDGFDGQAPGYRYSEEFAALLAPSTHAAAQNPAIRLGGYADLDVR